MLGRPATVESLASTGLALETGGRTFVALVRAVASVDAVRTPPDLVFLAVKSMIPGRPAGPEAARGDGRDDLHDAERRRQ